MIDHHPAPRAHTSTDTPRRRCLRLAPVLLAAAVLPACETDRRIVVTSEPPGARVWLNDVEVGRTPTEATFKFYGNYDVRLELDGHQTVQTARKARAPIHEQPGLDLIALLTPGTLKSRVEWHFDLDPLPERTQAREELEEDLLDRARGLRDRLGGPPPPRLEPDTTNQTDTSDTQPSAG